MSAFAAKADIRNGGLSDQEIWIWQAGAIAWTVRTLLFSARQLRFQRFVDVVRVGRSFVAGGDSADNFRANGKYVRERWLRLRSRNLFQLPQQLTVDFQLAAGQGCFHGTAATLPGQADALVRVERARGLDPVQ